MEVETLQQLVLQSLKYYDEQCIEHFYLINSNDIQIKQNIGEVTFILEDDNKSKTFQLEILGYFDNQTNIWFWAWILFIDYNMTKITRGLLEYGLKLELPKIIEQFYIKSLLVNSQIQFTEYTQLDSLIAICSYLLKTKILFILPVKKYLDNKKDYITFYYLIK
jgi:hypothetical protein